MKTKMSGIIGCAAALMAGGSVLFAGGCLCAAPAPKVPAQTPEQVSGEPTAGQPLFDSKDALVDALLTAAKAQDHAKVHQLLGPGWKELISGDPVEDADALKEFGERATEHMRLETQNAATSILHVGNDDWSFPIPIASTSGGKWFLDTEAGKDELLARRIGKDELDAIQICRIYVKAQQQYAAEVDGGNMHPYAQKILSTQGQTDGLYWVASANQTPSPLGHLVAEAKLEGYEPTPGQTQLYLGYHFRILKQQGPSAHGGKIDYVRNGKMTAGFAVVAYPAAYESSGIMTFIVNQDGAVFQKDLGPETIELARHMMAYNPDSSWTSVSD